MVSDPGLSRVWRGGGAVWRSPLVVADIGVAGRRVCGSCRVRIVYQHGIVERGGGRVFPRSILRQSHEGGEGGDDAASSRTMYDHDGE